MESLREPDPSTKNVSVAASGWALVPLRGLFPLVAMISVAACGESIASKTPAHDAAIGDATQALPPDVNDAHEAGPTSPPEGIVSASSASAFEGETEIAIAPDGTTAISWNGTPAATSTQSQHIGYTFWTPGAASFTPVQTEIATGTPYSTDSTVIADAQGNFFLVWLGIDFMVGTRHVYVATAPHGTTTFGAPVRVSAASDTGVDKPWVIFTSAGTMLISYSSIAPDGVTSSITVARSTDAVIFTRTTLTSGDEGLAYLCKSAKKSRVYLTDKARDDIDAAAAQWTVVLRWSDDDGQTWPGQNLAVVPPSPNIDGIPSCVADGADVWIDYEEYAGAGAGDSVHVLHSSDDGQTFGQDTVASGHDPLPLLRGDQLTRASNGDLLVFSYGGSRDGDPDASFDFVKSVDKGTTFSLRHTVHSPIFLNLTRHKPRWLGDYVGVRPFGASLYVSYVDNTGSDQTSHIRFSKVNP